MNIWVFSQESNGVPTSATLELLTKARSLGTVAAFVGGDASAIAGALGEHGATSVYATGDLGGKLPGVAVSAAMMAALGSAAASGTTPDLIMFPQTYEGRDVMSRLSVKLDRTVLTNNIDVIVDGAKVSVTTPIFGGNTLVTTQFTGAAPHLAAFRPKSFWSPPRYPSSVPRVEHRSRRSTPRRRPVRSSTKPRSWCRVAAVSVKLPSMQWSKSWPSC
ncbi:MAG: etfA [Acidimicrobiaceae bacterium]|nr:MAG: etfA [Acidimicrobiaceae bacterium]